MQMPTLFAPALLAPGQQVRLHSLSKPELNGQLGIVHQYDQERGRWSVTLSTSSSGGSKAPSLLVRPHNLEAIEESMEMLSRRMPDDVRRQRAHAAATLIREWAMAASSTVTESRESLERRLKGDRRVWQIDCVFTEDECHTIIQHINHAAARRGWDKVRHGKYPTTDLPLDAVKAIEPFVRARVFSKVLRPLQTHYMQAGFLPEHMELRDAFFVRYSAADGQQRGLEMHTDGSVFSFNVLLSSTAAFDGGGTFFESTGVALLPPTGGALGHSGQLRHAGVDITRGERYLLVGFVGSIAAPYTVAAVDWATHDAFCRFGSAAWEREPIEEAHLVVDVEPPLDASVVAEQQARAEKARAARAAAAAGAPSTSSPKP